MTDNTPPMPELGNAVPQVFSIGQRRTRRSTASNSTPQSVSNLGTSTSSAACRVANSALTASSNAGGTRRTLDGSNSDDENDEIKNMALFQKEDHLDCDGDGGTSYTEGDEV